MDEMTTEAGRRLLEHVTSGLPIADVPDPEWPAQWAEAIAAIEAEARAALLAELEAGVESTPDRRRWNRLTLTLPPEASARLDDLSRAHFRDRKREALRLLLDGIAREWKTGERRS